MWFVQPLQVADKDGKPTGRWRLTAKSDEGGGGPYGDPTHDHATAEEAMACDACDEYCCGWTGFLSRKQQAEFTEKHERAELLRLMQKYPPTNLIGKYANTNPLTRLHPGEPCFFLRAQDMHSSYAVRQYAEAVGILDPKGKEECLVIADLIEKWQDEHPDLVKQPD